MGNYRLSFFIIQRLYRDYTTPKKLKVTIQRLYRDYTTPKKLKVTSSTSRGGFRAGCRGWRVGVQHEFMRLKIDPLPEGSIGSCI